MERKRGFLWVLAALMVLLLMAGPAAAKEFQFAGKPLSLYGATSMYVSKARIMTRKGVQDHVLDHGGGLVPDIREYGQLIIGTGYMI
jgi:hypothetical protein